MSGPRCGPAEPAPRGRALVVRSGARSFLAAIEPTSVEIVEKASHVIQPALSGEAALDRPAQLAIFTSAIAVERLFSVPDLERRFRTALAEGKVAAVGPATGEALRRHGVAADLTAAGSGRNVLDRLPGRLDGWRVILPRGDDATRELPEELADRGAIVEPILLYRKEPVSPDPALEREILERPFAVFFATSPSAGRWLFTGIGGKAREVLRRTTAVALGGSTRRFLEAHGVERIEVASQPTFPAALRLIEAIAGGRPRV